jgi:hypothetical protein
MPSLSRLRALLSAPSLPRLAAAGWRYLTVAALGAALFAALERLAGASTLLVYGGAALLPIASLLNYALLADADAAVRRALHAGGRPTPLPRLLRTGAVCAVVGEAARRASLGLFGLPGLLAFSALLALLEAWSAAEASWAVVRLEPLPARTRRDVLLVGGLYRLLDLACHALCCCLAWRTGGLAAPLACHLLWAAADPLLAPAAQRWLGRALLGRQRARHLAAFADALRARAFRGAL